MKHVVVLFAATLLSFSCTRTESGAAGAANKMSGRIRGVVRLQGALPAPVSEPVKEHDDVCGHEVPLQRIALGNGNGVKDSFVYLDGVADGRSFPMPDSVLVDQRQCRYTPHAMIVPAGAKLEITNSDPILHNVHGLQMTENGMQTVFNIAQPVRGQRTVVEPPLTHPGIIYLACEAGHAWMNAYVFVAANAYVALTNGSGEFLMSDVPPGTYRIKMWHEGVIRKRNIEALQRYEYEDPYEMTQEVVVTAGSESVVTFDLSLRNTIG